MTEPQDPDPGPTDNICGAKTRVGGICMKPGLANGRCRNHGGKSPVGIEAANFKTGRYSAELKRVTEDLSHRIDDPALVDPRRSLAVQETVMAKFYAILADNDSPDFRGNVQAMHADATTALDAGELDVAKGILKRMGNLIERGAMEVKSLAALQESAEAMNRSQSRYWKTALGASRAISPEEFVGLMTKMADIIETEVDTDAARRILARTDNEICGGVLGLTRSETKGEAPR